MFLESKIKMVVPWRKRAEGFKERVSNIKDYKSSTPYTLLQELNKELIGAKRLDSELLKAELNITSECVANLHCLYYSKKDKEFKDYVMYIKEEDSGEEARSYLEEMIGGEIKEHLGEQAASDYYKTFLGIFPLIRWVRQRNTLIGISMNYVSEDMLASYTAFIVRFS